jgi:hypothetical protein
VLDFVGAFVDAGDAQVAVSASDGHFSGVAHAAVDLHDAVDHAVGHVGAVEFGHAGFVTVVQALVGFPGGVAELLHCLLCQRIGNCPLLGEEHAVVKRRAQFNPDGSKRLLSGRKLGRGVGTKNHLV